MGCQRAIAQTIVDWKADYVLAPKGNQKTLYRDVALSFKGGSEREIADTLIR